MIDCYAFSKRRLPFSTSSVAKKERKKGIALFLSMEVKN